jgi:hypothetical protein
VSWSFLIHLTLLNADDVRIVQISHGSVKEFLTLERLAKSEKGDLSQHCVSLELAHTVLSRYCIGTLLQSNVQVTSAFPLATYATLNWFHHTRCDGVAFKIHAGMMRLFDPDRTYFEAWLAIYYDIDDPQYQYALHIV